MQLKTLPESTILQFKICFGITRGRMLTGELSACKFQKLVSLHLFTGLFKNFSPIVRRNDLQSSVLSCKRGKAWMVLCCIMTPGLSKDIRCHV